MAAEEGASGEGERGEAARFDRRGRGERRGGRESVVVTRGAREETSCAGDGGRGERAE